MILENQYERKAFEFMYKLASELTSRNGCNDLETKDVKDFGGLTTPTDDDGKIIQKPILYDYQVCYWLKLQVKKGE